MLVRNHRIAAFFLAFAHMMSWSAIALADSTEPAATASLPKPVQSPTTAHARPWAMRLDLGFPFPPSGVVGFTVGYTLVGRVALEYSTGLSLGWSHAIMARPRFHLTPQSSLFVGGGVSCAVYIGDEKVRSVARFFAHGEVGYEYRSQDRLTFLVALGMSNDTKTLKYPPPTPGGFDFDLDFGMLPYVRIGFGETF